MIIADNEGCIFLIVILALCERSQTFSLTQIWVKRSFQVREIINKLYSVNTGNIICKIKIAC